MNRLLLSLFAASLVGCGSDSSDSDTLAPTLSHSSEEPAASAGSDFTLSFTSSEAGSVSIEGQGCQLSADTQARAGENSLKITVGAQTGRYSCAIRVTDAAGNVSEALVLPALTVDRTPPQLSHEMGAIGNTSQTQHAITFTSSEPGALSVSGDDCQLGAPPVTASEGNNTVQLQVGAKLGSYSCVLMVTDAVGNASEPLALPVVTVVSLDTRLTLYISDENTLIDVPELPLSYEIYRSQQADCDLTNYASCEQGQLDVTSGETQLTDTALLVINPDDQQQPAKTAYYTLKADGKTAQASIDVRSGWGGRTTWSMTPVNLNGQLFLFNGQFQSKIWTSSDAINWTEVSDHNFDNRVFTDATVFNNRIWALGGRQGNNRIGDVWSSGDGKTWRRELSSVVSQLNAFGSREFHQLVTYNNALYLIGGRTLVNGNATDVKDVWKSEDGISWTQLTADTGMSNTLYDHQALAIDNDGIYVFYNNDYQSNPRLMEIWKSTDGISWAKLSEVPFRSDFSVAYQGGKFVIVGGTDTNGGISQVLTSSDAISWQETAATGNFVPFRDSDILVFNNRLWRYGGQTATGSGTDVIQSSPDGIDWRIPQTVEFNFQSDIQVAR